MLADAGSFGMRVGRRRETAFFRNFPMRTEANFFCQFKVICPVQPSAEKYSYSFQTQISAKTLGIPSRKRGVGHRHERWDGMRWTRKRRARGLDRRAVL